MPNLMLELMVDRVDLVDEGANSEAFIKLYKRKETEDAMTFEDILKSLKPGHAEVVQAELAKAKSEVPTEVTEELNKAKQDVQTLSDELATAKASLEDVAKSKNSTEPDFEEVLKSLDPSVQEVFKSLKAQKDAAEQVAREAADRAAHEEAVNKSKELKSLPVAEDKLVEVVKGISPEIFEILKSASKAIEDGGLFEEVGKSKDGASETGGDAWSKIEKAAEKIAEETKVSKAKAIAQAVKENPDLYREYLKGGNE